MIKDFYRFLNPNFQKLYLEYKIDFKPRYGFGKSAHPELAGIIEAGREQYKTLISKILSYKEYLWTIKDAKNEIDPKEPAWNNGFLPGLDIMSLYTMIAEFQPRKYIEIGSGNSTKVAFKAKTEQCPGMEIVTIDPVPRSDIEGLADKIIKESLESVKISIPVLLKENDILYVDSSHRILPNSDSLVFYLEILPKLKKGVIVHIHDVYIPYDYPQFMCDRFYSEQYGLAILLLANPGKYQILLPNYFISQDKEISGLISGVWENENLYNVEKHGGSFWFRIS